MAWPCRGSIAARPGACWTRQDGSGRATARASRAASRGCRTARVSPSTSCTFPRSPNTASCSASSGPRWDLRTLNELARTTRRGPMRPERSHVMRSSRVLLGMTAALAVTIVFASANQAAAQKRGGNLRVAYGNEIAGLDFHTTPGYEMVWVATNIGCGLIGITPDGKFLPEAAESWQISPDGLLYTFRLRKNVLFHDGTKVDAAAVKFTIERLMDPAVRSSMRAFLESVHSVEVIDPYTVQIRLKHPYAFMLHMLAAYRMGLVLVSPANIQKYSPEERRSGKPEAGVGR